MKKGWKKPMVTVISKGMIEENVLESCKHGITVADGGGPNATTCGWYKNDGSWIGPCSNASFS
jgi:hypothetical protein